MEMVGNQGILERGLEGPKLRMSTQETESKGTRRMGERLGRGENEMKE